MFGDVAEVSAVGSRALRHVVSRADASLEEHLALLSADLDAASAEAGERLATAAELERERLASAVSKSADKLDFSSIEGLEKCLGASATEAQRRVALLRATMERHRLPETYPALPVPAKDTEAVMELVEGLAMEIRRQSSDEAA